MPSDDRRRFLGVVDGPGAQVASSDSVAARVGSSRIGAAHLPPPDSPQGADCDLPPPDSSLEADGGADSVC